MAAQITDDADLLKSVSMEFEQGTIWLTIPPLGQVMGPIPFPEYVPHRKKHSVHPELASVEAARIDPDKLPPCHSPDHLNDLADDQG